MLLFDHLRKPKPDNTAETHTFVEELGEKVVWGSNDPLPMLYEEGFRHVRSLSFDEACLTLTGTYAREREFHRSPDALDHCAAVGRIGPPWPQHQGCRQRQHRKRRAERGRHQGSYRSDCRG